LDYVTVEIGDKGDPSVGDFDYVLDNTGTTLLVSREDMLIVEDLEARHRTHQSTEKEVCPGENK